MPPPALAADTGYAQTSYYTTLALYVLAFPGVYSLVKRSVKSKMVRKTYEVAGPAAPAGRPMRELAGDILAFFQAASETLPRHVLRELHRRASPPLPPG